MGKIGEGHVEAMGRLGLHELRGMLYPESNVAQRSEYGLYGTRTPGEVAEARRDDLGFQMEAGGDVGATSNGPEPAVQGGLEEGPPVPDLDL